MIQTNILPTTVIEGTHTLELRHLHFAELGQLDAYLAEVGEFGELRLIIEKGRIRFVEVVKIRRVGGG